MSEGREPRSSFSYCNHFQNNLSKTNTTKRQLNSYLRERRLLPDIGSPATRGLLLKYRSRAASTQTGHYLKIARTNSSLRKQQLRIIWQASLRDNRGITAAASALAFPGRRRRHPPAAQLSMSSAVQACRSKRRRPWWMQAFSFRPSPRAKHPAKHQIVPR